MTASLYQSAASGSGGAASATATSWLFSRNTEDVRRQDVGIELHEIAPAAPGVVAGRDQILQSVAFARRAVEIEPAALRVARIEIYRDQDQVVALLFRVAQELVVVRRMEFQVPVALQRRVLAPYLIQLGNQASQAVGPLSIPALDLVFLGIQ